MSRAKLIENLDELIAEMNGIREDMYQAAVIATDQERRAHYSETTHHRSTGAVQVMIQMSIRRIFRIDVKTETFGAQVVIRMMWKANPDEDLPKVNDGSWSPSWTPKYRFRKLIKDTVLQENYSYHHVGEDAYITAEWDHLLTIFEALKLQSFPVDVQDLCIALLSVPSIEHIVWVPWPESMRKELVTLQSQHVTLDDFVLMKECPFTYDLSTFHSDDALFSLFCTDVKVSRKANYYMLNVAAIMMLIVSATLTAWGIHPANITGRQKVDFILLLTAVAFRLVLAGELPPVTYITLLDIYVFGGFFFITVVILVHTFLPFRKTTWKNRSPLTYAPATFPGEDDLIWIDNVAFWVILGTWGAFNVIYFAFMFFCGLIGYYKHVKESKDHQKKSHAQIAEMRKDNHLQ